MRNMHGQRSRAACLFVSSVISRMGVLRGEDEPFGVAKMVIENSEISAAPVSSLVIR